MTREENIATVRNFVSLLEQRRFEEFAELFVEDAKWAHPFHSGLFPAETIGREEIYNALKTAAGNFDEIQLPPKEPSVSHPSLVPNFDTPVGEILALPFASRVKSL